MAMVWDYAAALEADYHAAATEAGWTEDEKVLFLAALLEATCDLIEKPH